MKSMHGLIWVVDSEDRDRFKESRDELMNLLQSDSIRGQIPILLFANKQDRKHALQPSDQGSNDRLFRSYVLKLFLILVQPDPWFWNFLGPSLNLSEIIIFKAEIHGRSDQVRPNKSV